MENELPPGGTEKDVADDIPAQLSEGEFIIPANVVRFIGLDKLEKMINKANEELTALEENGRIGGQAAPEEEEEALPFPEEELVGYAQGGLVEGAENKTPQAANTLPQDKGFSGVRQFKNANGQTMYVPFVNGSPLFTVPTDYAPLPDTTGAAPPDPNAQVAKPATPSSQPIARNSQEGNVNTEGLQGNLAGDIKGWTPEDFVNYGKQKGSIGEKAVKGIISIMPGGMLAWKGRQKYLDKNTGAVLDQMIETGLDQQGKPITPEMKQDLLNTKTKLAQDLSGEAGKEINPMERVTNMIQKFADFVTGNPNVPEQRQSTVSRPVDTGTSSYTTNPSLSYKSEYNKSPTASRSTLDANGGIATQSAPPSRSSAFGSDNDRPSGSSGRSATGGAVYKKGGLVTRPKATR